MSDIQARLACASSFILQSPPGEVNDVFNDVRALVGDDEALEAGILPALQKYNIEQLIVADLPDKQQLMICPSGSVQDETNRFIEPSTAKAWLFDHLRLSASDAVDIQVDTECETIRTELERAASTYGSEHFSEGVSKVFTTEQRKLKPAPKPKAAAASALSEPTPSSQEHVQATMTETHDETAMQEDKAEAGTSAAQESKVDTELVDPETAPPADEDESATTDAAEPAVASSGVVGSEDKTEAIDTDMASTEAETTQEIEENAATSEVVEDVTTADASEEVSTEEPSTATETTEQVSEPVVEEEEETPLEPLPKKFSLYFVGNKYNPSNYWTGRWRSSYELDLSQNQPSLTGTIQINVHFFEQGNVQLATNYTPTIVLPDSVTISSAPADIAKATIKAIAKVEEEYQLELNEAYRDMADRTFRNLRRVLPVTRQKMDWAKVASYRIGKTLSGE